MRERVCEREKEREYLKFVLFLLPTHLPFASSRFGSAPLSKSIFPMATASMVAT